VIRKYYTKTLLLYRKSSVGTTHINNGFQSGDQEMNKKNTNASEMSSVGTTHTNNGFQTGDQKILNKNFSPLQKKFRRNDTY